MIIRIVRMTFQVEKMKEFENLFKEVKPSIEKFDGCKHVSLLKDVNDKKVYFTYSIWESEHYLNQYRFSSFFKQVWSKTKPLFDAKAEAWSLEEVK